VRLASWLFEQIRTCNEEKDTTEQREIRLLGTSASGGSLRYCTGRLSDGDLPWLPKTSLLARFPFMCAPPVCSAGCV